MGLDLKNELVDGRTFPSFEHAEHETLSWIGFYNNERLHENLGDVPPAEYEQTDNQSNDNCKQGNNRTLSTR
ncbi:MAG: transposase [Microthrixaceae bacterium]|nr:transposase [Microthrixaceae bacterium]